MRLVRVLKTDARIPEATIEATFCNGSLTAIISRIAVNVKRNV